MMNDVPKRRPGRPRRPSEEGARIQQSLRMRPSVNEEIRAAAEKNFRSISEELESRIDNSCDCIVVSTKDNDLLDKVSKAAGNNKWSVETESQFRLQRSFFMDKVFDDPQTCSLLMLIASDIMQFEKDIEKKWYEASDEASEENVSLISETLDEVICSIVKNRMAQQINYIRMRREYGGKYRRAVLDDDEAMNVMAQFDINKV